jgi:hypothetical protein
MSRKIARCRDPLAHMFSREIEGHLGSIKFQIRDNVCLPGNMAALNLFIDTEDIFQPLDIRSPGNIISVLQTAAQLCKRSIHYEMDSSESNGTITIAARTEREQAKTRARVQASRSARSLVKAKP